MAHRLYLIQTTQHAVARPPANTTNAKIIVASSDVRIAPLYVVCGIFACTLWCSPSSARPMMCADVVKLCISMPVIVLRDEKKHIFCQIIKSIDSVCFKATFTFVARPCRRWNSSGDQRHICRRQSFESNEREKNVRYSNLTKDGISLRSQLTPADSCRRNAVRAF